MMRGMARRGLPAAVAVVIAGCTVLDTSNEMLRQGYKRLTRNSRGPELSADTSDPEWDQYGLEARQGMPVEKDNDPFSWLKSEKHRAIERSLGVTD